MQEIFVDWETASELDLTEVGSPLYFAHPSTRGLMCSWAINDRKVRVWEPDLEPMPEEMQAALLDPSFRKLAWNVKHEQKSFLKFCGLDIPLEQWFDIMILSSYMSLPRKLDTACKALALPPSIAKMAEAGKVSIELFCKPARMGGAVTLFGIEPTFYNSRENKPIEWDQFKEYCAGDTEVERHIYRQFAKNFPLPEQTLQEWYLDHIINERGMPTSPTYAANALKMATDSTDTLRARLIELTGLVNPNSDQKMLAWLRKNGYPFTSTGKNMVVKALKTADLTVEAQHVLRIRQEFKKVSYHKLEELLKRVSADGRLRDMFAFLGASRTGRWAGQDVQFQNIARPNKKVEEMSETAAQFINTLDLPGAIASFAPEYEIKGQKFFIPSAIDMVTSMLRSTFQASPGKQFVVSDLSAIENRVLGWVAGCEEILNVFRNGLDPYVAFAVKMYNLPYSVLIKDKDKRQVAKPAVLGCGYGLGPGVSRIENKDGSISYNIIWQCSECMEKFTDTMHVCEDENGNQLGDLKMTGLMGYADNMGVTLTPQQAWESHRAFQDAYKEVPALWSNIERAVVRVLRTGVSQKLHFVEYSRVSLRNGQYVLVCKLPSGRCLHYMNARIESEEKISKAGNPYTKHNIYYDGIGHGVGATTKKLGWAKVYTYGGKLCLAGNTRIVTSNGIKPLTDVSIHDKLWDGKNWVDHDGLIFNGEKETCTWMGLTGTSDHQILVGNEWRELGKITNRSGLCSLLTGLASAIRLWYSQNRERAVGQGCFATADKFSMLERGQCDGIMLNRARVVVAEQDKLSKSSSGDITSFLTPNFDKSGSEDLPEFSPAAITQNVPPIRIMVDGESHVTNHGEKAEANGSNMPSHCPDGIIQLLTLIEQTMTETTNPEISDWCLGQKIQTTVEALCSLRGMEKNSPMRLFIDDFFPNGVRTLFATILTENEAFNGVSKDTNKQRVYDVVNCGPLNRFTVLSDAGPIIVHNCENIVQAIARDILAHWMVAAHKLGMFIVGHVHDEIICEEDLGWEGFGLADLNQCLANIFWAPGLPLAAGGYEARVYRK